ncbi:transglutaminase-like domain-containing protein [Solwaraspora sp. WMMB335]|uniref:transglutaminase-like domain-containing protein n=1 Tax=Solwaraspora sp. WMMB335 TaxID=3404118 RepID=UPI003B957E86
MSDRMAAAGSVGCDLVYEVAAAATVVLQVTAYRQSPDARLIVTADGERADGKRADGKGAAAEEIAGSWAAGGRQHLLRAPAGRLSIHYRSSTAVPGPVTPAEVTVLDRVVWARPSRYCPSDRLGGFAAGHFGHYGSSADTVRAICDYVYEHTAYTAGASGPSTDAAETLLAGAGVCRDFAHLVVALCRALDIPARVAAVYAPGLSPMDFHLVAEAAVGDRWYVWDATRLAPRASMVRIATGRDATDVAFATIIGGQGSMDQMSVSAIAPTDLPVDDHHALVALR